MAIIRAYETPVRRHGSIDLDSNTSDDVRRFVIVTDNDRDDDQVILACSILPKFYERHPSGKLLYARYYDASQIQDSPKHWIVEVRYVNSPSGGGVDPMLEPPVERWSSRPREVPCDVTTDGFWIKNFVNEPVEPPMRRETHDELLTLEFNLAQFDRSFWAQYIGRVNDRSFLGWSEHQAKLEQVNATTLYTPLGQKYVRMTVQFAFRSNRIHHAYTNRWEEAGWQEARVQIGYKYWEKQDDGTVKLVNVAEKGETMPVALDMRGFKLADNAEPEVTVYKIHEAVDFSPLLKVMRYG